MHLSLIEKIRHTSRGVEKSAPQKFSLASLAYLKVASSPSKDKPSIKDHPILLPGFALLRLADTGSIPDKFGGLSVCVKNLMRKL